MPKRADLERRALQIITAKGSEGIPQCDLWRELDASSREGSRIAIRLEKKNLVQREKEFFGGRWTYRIFINKHPIEIDSIMDVPCVSCSEILKCEVGSDITPNRCIKMTQWLLSGDEETSIDRND